MPSTAFRKPMSSRPQHYQDSPQYPNGHPEYRAKQHRIRTCNYCDEEYEHGHDGDYCSPECKYNGIAYDALRAIRHDHTRCLSCFRQLKILIPPGRHRFDTSRLEEPRAVNRLSKDIPTYPPPDHPGAISVGGVVAREKSLPGYQWDVGEEFRANPTEDDWEFTPQGTKSTKTCECGVSHHGTAEYLKKDLSCGEAVKRTQRLTTILDEWIAADEWDHAYDTDKLFSMVKKLKNDPKDRASGKDFEIFERSLGAAVRKAEYNR